MKLVQEYQDQQGENNHTMRRL